MKFYYLLKVTGTHVHWHGPFDSVEEVLQDENVVERSITATVNPQYWVSVDKATGESVIQPINQ